MQPPMPPSGDFVIATDGKHGDQSHYARAIYAFQPQKCGASDARILGMIRQRTRTLWPKQCTVTAESRAAT